MSCSAARAVADSGVTQRLGISSPCLVSGALGYTAWPQHPRQMTCSYPGGMDAR